MFEIVYKDNNTTRFKITSDEPVDKIIQLVLTMRNNMFIGGKTNSSKDNELCTGERQLNSVNKYDIQEFKRYSYHTYSNITYKKDNIDLEIFLTTGLKYSSIFIIRNLTITKEDLNKIKELLLENYIFKDEISSNNYINIRTTICPSIDPDDNQLKVKYEIIHNKIPAELTHETFSIISNYFKKEEKLDLFKKIFQINMILDLTPSYYFRFREPYLSECIKKFNFDFTVPPVEIETDLDEILNNIFRKTTPKEITIKLSKYLTLSIVNYFIKKIKLKISPWEEITALALSTNPTNSLRKKYIYGFLYNNNFIQKFKRDLLKFSILDL